MLAVSLVAVGVLVNLWLLLIGVFVYVGATAEEAATTIHVRLAGRPVAEVMLHDPVMLDPGMSAAELGTLARRTTQRVFPVVGPSGYVGLLRLGAVPHDPARLVADLADRGSTVLSPAASVEQDALPLIVSSPSRAVAVADDGHIVGLLCIEDVEHLLADSA